MQEWCAIMELCISYSPDAKSNDICALTHSHLPNFLLYFVGLGCPQFCIDSRNMEGSSGIRIELLFRLKRNPILCKACQEINAYMLTYDVVQEMEVVYAADTHSFAFASCGTFCLVAL